MRLTAFLKIARDLGGSLGLGQLLSRVMDNVFRILPQSRRGHLLLVDAADGVLRTAAIKQARDASEETIGPLDDGLIATAMDRGTAILGADLRGSLKDSVFDAPSVLCIPLLNRSGRSIGVVHLESEDGEEYTSSDLEVVSNVAVLISQSIENATLSDAHYRSVVDTAADAIITVDEHGVIETANPAVEQLFGCKHTELIQQSITRLLTASFANEIQRELTHAVRSDQPVSSELMNASVGLRKDGTRFPIAMSVGEFSLAGGRRFTLIMRDMTDREHGEAELKRMNEQLERKNEEMSQFVYTVSHDLKSPLVTCRGFVGLMREDLAEGRVEDLQDSINRLESATNRMSDLIEGLLHLSRLGAVRNESESVDLNILIRSISTDLEERFEQAGAQLVVADELPTVVADPVRLGEVIDNLLTNAVKYGCPNTGMQVEIQAETISDGFRLSVRDHGPGIAPEYHEQVFSLFERLQTTGEGTGVGLAIVRRIAELHGGRAWVELPADGGAMFVATFKA